MADFKIEMGTRLSGLKSINTNLKLPKSHLQKKVLTYLSKFDIFFKIGQLILPDPYGPHMGRAKNLEGGNCGFGY